MSKLFLILFSFCFIHSFAQKRFVTIRFVVDGNQIPLKNDFKVGFIRQKDSIIGVVEGDKFLLPDVVKNGDNLILFFINSKYSLLFKDFTVALNPENSLWEIGVDEKPFDKKKYWAIKKWKRVKLVYYIQDSNGGRLTICKE